MTVTIKMSWWHLAGFAVVMVVAWLVLWQATAAGSQPEGLEPLSTFAFVARADNPVDALAASSVAGQLGAPVYLSGSESLDAQARQGLADTDPDVVVLAGGVAALSRRWRLRLPSFCPIVRCVVLVVPVGLKPPGWSMNSPWSWG